MKILGVIPARYKSTRLPGKPLIKINGIEMIKRTYNQCLKSNLLDKVVVATDDLKIYNFCKKEDINAVMTSLECKTGTDRVAEVSKLLDYDLYINIQGDEPVIDPISFDLIIEEYKKTKGKYLAYNAYKIIESKEEIESDSIIKVIINENKELMYMSRLAVPFNKSKEKRDYLKQVCVYGFTKEALEIFNSKEKTLNEKYEDVEVLRFLDSGYKVKMVEADVSCIAVDKEEDILKVEKYLNENNLD
ncbi:MAG: 3-deoxy-manno-octulosonate cytidylyltransferase [Cetobacterium sp.]